MSDEMRQPPEVSEEPGPQEASGTFPPAGAVGEAPGRNRASGHNGGTRGDRKAWARRAAHPTVAGAQPPKIGLWGSPGSGKTTYLASLPHALARTDGSVGKWTIHPQGKAAAELLKRWQHRLIEEQMFPEPTPLGNVTNLAWHFAGDLTGSRYMRRGVFGRRPSAKSEFDLDLIDVSGEIFRYNSEVSQETVDIALDHLARAEGLIFLFDPITERDKPTAARYMYSTLMELSLRVEDSRRIERYLPHYISVCITKLDHTEVFKHAREAGLVNYGPDGMPRVLGDHAEELFNVICEGRFFPEQRTDPHGGALLVHDQLREYFHPGRIRYYAISSIGYKKPPGWDHQAAMRPGFQFDPKNFSKVVEPDPGKKKILGPIEPINVLEPLVELQMQITGRA